MSKAVINFKVDGEVKEEAQKIARELGMPLSSIVNAQLRELIRTRTLNVSAEPRMTPYLENILENVERDRKTGKNVTRTNSLEEALAHLDSL
jgi:addiction module RelB/DinJ family antitoxin